MPAMTAADAQQLQVHDLIYNAYDGPGEDYRNCWTILSVRPDMTAAKIIKILGGEDDRDWHPSNVNGLGYIPRHGVQYIPQGTAPVVPRPGYRELDPEWLEAVSTQATPAQLQELGVMLNCEGRRGSIISRLKCLGFIFRGCELCCVNGAYSATEGCRHWICTSCNEILDISETHPCIGCATSDRRLRCGLCCRHVACSPCLTSGLPVHWVSRETTCPNCGGERHTDCCSCNLCDNCGTNVQGCDECSSCNGCCDCETGGCFPAQKLSWQKYEASPNYKGLKRLLGTELETADAKTYSSSLALAVNKWHASIVTDGSIASDRGMELVTSAAGGDKWIRMITDLGRGFKDSQTKTHTSCGQHVHVNAKDMDVWALRRFLVLYAKVESALFDALPAERKTNHYCMPCGSAMLDLVDSLDPKATKQELAAAFYGVSLRKPLAGKGRKRKNASMHRDNRNAISDVSSAKYNDLRYRALNLHSYWFRGTLEFRHAHGTNNPAQIINWGFVCGSLVEYAVVKSDSDVLAFGNMPPKDVMRNIGLPPATLEWLEGRWLLFASGDAVRHPKTGEI